MRFFLSSSFHLSMFSIVLFSSDVIEVMVSFLEVSFTALLSAKFAAVYIYRCVHRYQSRWCDMLAAVEMVFIRGIFDIGKSEFSSCCHDQNIDFSNDNVDSK